MCSETKRCARCKVEKPVSEFGWFKSRGAKGCFASYCKVCRVEYQRQWAEANRSRIRDRCRRTTLGTSKGTLGGLNKRIYTGYCEVCGAIRDKNLKYHHWDDTNPSKGIWVCPHCHWLLELSDNGQLESIITNYIKLRKEL